MRRLVLASLTVAAAAAATTEQSSPLTLIVNWPALLKKGAATP